MNSPTQSTDHHDNLPRANRLAEARITAAFVLAVSVLTLGAWISYQQTQRLIDAGNRAIDTQKVLTELGDTYGAISDLENAQRAYQITGAPEFLAGSQKSLADITQSLQQLQDCVSDNPDSNHLLEQLTANVAARVEFARNNIRLRQERGYKAANSEDTSGAGRQLTDDIRHQIRQMERREQQLLAKRNLAVKHDSEGMLTCLGGLSLVAVVLLLLAFRCTQLAWTRHKRSEETALRQADEAEEARATLAATLMSMGDGLYQLDKDGRLVYLNAAGERMLGYALDEIRGLNMHDLIHSRNPAGDQKPASECPLLAVITKGVVYEEFEDHFLRKDGSFLPVHYVSSPMRVRDHVVGAVLSFRDITERKLAEQAVRRSEERFRAIFDHTFEFIGIMSPEGVLLEANETALAFEGIKATDVIGRHFCDTPWWAHSKDLRRQLQDSIEKAAAGEFVRFEAEHAGPSGIITVDFSIKPVRDETGKVTMLIPEGRDITDRKRAEERFREFYSMISHELRTPLTSIRTSFGLLESGKAGELSSKAAQLAKIGCTESDRLIRLINEILDFNKIESGKLELKQKGCVPEELLTATMDGLKATADHINVSITANVACTETVTCDADRIIQVLTNLLSNAIKFSEPGGSVAVEIIKTGAGRVRFSVTDNGPGIPASQIHKLFTKFQQMDGSETRSKGGTGLGLAISKTIIELHGGVIGVETEEGSGSKFWFELPSLPHN